MLLSRLADYRGKIRKLSKDELLEHADRILSKAIGDVQSDDPGLYHEQQDLIKRRELILEQIEQFGAELDLYKDRLEDLVREREVPLLQETYDRYEETLADTPKYIYDRFLFNTLIYRDDIKVLFKDRIKNYTSWKYPALYIRPESGDYAEGLMDCDPLYFADWFNELLDPVQQRWTKEYQARLRYYLIRKEAPYFKGMPENQFGLIVAMNYFNYLPLDVIREYLAEIWNLLRKGGVFVFTYNNCDNYTAVKNAEAGLYAYTPGRLLQSMIEGLGFEIIHSQDYEDTNVSWLEIRKPGQIQSIRGGQALAQIKDSRLDN